MRSIYILIFVAFMGCSASKLDASYYYKAEYGVAIEKILEKYEVTEAQLLEWNPDYADAIKNSFFKGGEKLIIKSPPKSE